MKTDDFFPYKPQTVQELLPDDLPIRKNFAQNQLHSIENSEDFIRNLFFTDEAHCDIHGQINKQNVRFWSQENPHFVKDVPLHSPKLTIWAGVSYNGIIGPYFWELDPNFPDEKGVTSRWVRELYQNWVFPKIRRYRNRHQLIFQQDGAPPHHNNELLRLLDQEFPGRWMGRGTNAYPSPYPWPPRSCDLTVCDYWLWGYVKSKLYSVDPYPSTEELKKRILEVFKGISNDMIIRAINDYPIRLQKCVENDGKSVEIR